MAEYRTVEREERMPRRARRLPEHREDREDRGNDRTAGHGIDRGAVEPVARHPRQLESPHDEREGEYQDPVQAVASWRSALRVHDVAGHLPCREDELREEERGEDRERGEEPRRRLLPPARRGGRCPVDRSCAILLARMTSGPQDAAGEEVARTGGRRIPGEAVSLRARPAGYWEGLGIIVRRERPPVKTHRREP